MTAHAQPVRQLRKRFITIIILVILAALIRLIVGPWLTLAAVGEMRSQIHGTMSALVEHADSDVICKVQDAADRPIYRRTGHLMWANMVLDSVILLVLLVSMFAFRLGGSVPDREAQQDIRDDQDRD